MRINKYLAASGVASRRKVDELIEEGKVKVNGQIAKLGDQINPEKDKITVDGREVTKREEGKVYIALNKPQGYTSTVAKIKGEKNVLDLVKSNVRLYPVGRLDKDSTGLILLTNDGELTQKLTHPKFHIPKTYEVMVKGNVPEPIVKKLSTGVQLEDGRTKPADVSIINKTAHHTWLKIVLYEGKKRQIRRMMSTLHLHVLELKRISVGSIKLGILQVGKYRNLTKEELSKLQNFRQV